MYQIQRDKPDQGEEHEDLSEGQVPNISKTLFVKEVETLPGTLVSSELPAITSLIAPTQKVCLIAIYHGDQSGIRHCFQIISSSQLDHEDNEKKIKMIRMMGKILLFSNKNILLFSLQKRRLSHASFFSLL